MIPDVGSVSVLEHANFTNMTDRKNWMPYLGGRKNELSERGTHHVNRLLEGRDQYTQDREENWNNLEQMWRRHITGLLNRLGSWKGWKRCALGNLGQIAVSSQEAPIWINAEEALNKIKQGEVWNSRRRTRHLDVFIEGPDKLSLHTVQRQLGFRHWFITTSKSYTCPD